MKLSSHGDVYTSACYATIPPCPQCLLHTIHLRISVSVPPPTPHLLECCKKIDIQIFCFLSRTLLKLLYHTHKKVFV